MEGAGPYRNMLVMLIVACIPMIFVLVFKDFYTGIAADNDIVMEGVCFLITAALLFIADRCVKGHKGPGDIKPRDGLIVGLLQAVAPLPGFPVPAPPLRAGSSPGLTGRLLFSSASS